jgi:DNA-binding SARP family transcriptional activator
LGAFLGVFLDDAADVLIEDDDGVPVRALFALARALVFAGDHPVNRATLIGHLGADPEKRHLNSGDCVWNLRLATSTVVELLDLNVPDRAARLARRDVRFAAQLGEGHRQP